MEYTIIVSCVFVCVFMITRHNHKKTTETIRNLTQANVILYDEFEAELAVLREKPDVDSRTIFEKTLADFHNPSLIEEMYVACPVESCRREYLRIDKPHHICRECGTRFYEFPTAA